MKTPGLTSIMRAGSMLGRGLAARSTFTGMRAWWAWRGWCLVAADTMVGPSTDAAAKLTIRDTCFM
jgi:hypothetical protein